MTGKRKYWRDTIVQNVGTCLVYGQPGFLASHMVPQARSGVIPECRARSNL